MVRQVELQRVGWACPCPAFPAAPVPPCGPRSARPGAAARPALARAPAPTRRPASKARRAAATARSTSAWPQAATSASLRPSIGLSLECRAVGGIGGAVDVARPSGRAARLPVIQRVRCHVVQLPLRPARHHGVQQHVAAGFQVLRLRVLDFVVADAVLAGHEDHGGGRDRGHVHRVVSGAGDDVHGRQATVGGALAHLADQVGIEGRGPEILHVLQFHLDMVGRRRPCRPGAAPGPCG